MTNHSNRTRKPDPLDRAWVSGLVNELGLAGASQRLGLSRLATMNVATGGNCYGCTLRRVRGQRPGPSGLMQAT